MKNVVIMKKFIHLEYKTLNIIRYLKKKIKKKFTNKVQKICKLKY